MRQEEKTVDVCLSVCLHSCIIPFKWPWSGNGFGLRLSKFPNNRREGGVVCACVCVCVCACLICASECFWLCICFFFWRYWATWKKIHPSIVHHAKPLTDCFLAYSTKSYKYSGISYFTSLSVGLCCSQRSALNLHLIKTFLLSNLTNSDIVRS